MDNLQNYWPDDLSLDQIEKTIESIDRKAKRSFIELGMLLWEVERRRLWEGKAESFDSWARLFPIAYSTGRKALRIVKDLQDVPLYVLEGLPRFALEIARKVPQSLRSEPSVIEALMQKTEMELNEFVAKEYPQLHIDPPAPKEMICWTRGQRDVIDQAIAKVMEGEDSMTRADAIEMICAEFLTM